MIHQNGNNGWLPCARRRKILLQVRQLVSASQFHDADGLSVAVDVERKLIELGDLTRRIGNARGLRGTRGSCAMHSKMGFGLQPVVQSQHSLHRGRQL